MCNTKDVQQMRATAKNRSSVSRALAPALPATAQRSTWPSAEASRSCAGQTSTNVVAIGSLTQDLSSDPLYFIDPLRKRFRPATAEGLQHVIGLLENPGNGSAATGELGFRLRSGAAGRTSRCPRLQDSFTAQKTYGPVSGRGEEAGYEFREPVLKRTLTNAQRKLYEGRTRRSCDLNRFVKNTVCCGTGIQTTFPANRDPYLTRVSPTCVSSFSITTETTRPPSFTLI